MWAKIVHMTLRDSVPAYWIKNSWFLFTSRFSRYFTDSFVKSYFGTFYLFIGQKISQVVISDYRIIGRGGAGPIIRKGPVNCISSSPKIKTKFKKIGNLYQLTYGIDDGKPYKNFGLTRCHRNIAGIQQRRMNLSTVKHNSGYIRLIH